METQPKLETIYNALFKAGHPGTSDAEAEAAANYGVRKLRELYEKGLFTDTGNGSTGSGASNIKRDFLYGLATARVTHLEGEITKLKSSLREARKQRDAAKDEIAALKAKATKKAANSGTPYAVLSAKISELEDRLSTEVVNRMKAERENAALKGQPDPYRFIEKHEISELKKQLADELVTRTKLETEVADLKAQIAAFKTVPPVDPTEIRLLRLELHVAEVELQELKRQNAVLSAKADKLDKLTDVLAAILPGHSRPNTAEEPPPEAAQAEAEPEAPAEATVPPTATAKPQAEARAKPDTDQPTQTRTDEGHTEYRNFNGQLHNPHGPAIVTASGMGKWYLHGHNIPAKDMQGILRRLFGNYDWKRMPRTQQARDKLATELHRLYGK